MPGPHGYCMLELCSATPMSQVRSRATGRWVDLPPATPEACRVAVLVGAQLERAVGGAVRATEHRVVATAQGANVPRYYCLQAPRPARR